MGFPKKELLQEMHREIVTKTLGISLNNCSNCPWLRVIRNSPWSAVRQLPIRNIRTYVDELYAPHIGLIWCSLYRPLSSLSQDPLPVLLPSNLSRGLPPPVTYQVATYSNRIHVTHAKHTEWPMCTTWQTGTCGLADQYNTNYNTNYNRIK